MKRFNFEGLATRIFIVLSIILFIFLFISSLVYTGVNNWDLTYETVIVIKNNWFLVLVNMIVFIAVFILLYRTILLLDDRNKTIIGLIIIMLIIFAISIVLIESANTIPQSDQLMLCKTAVEFNNGDFSKFDYGGYIAACPHQLGFVTFLRIVFKVFGDFNYKIIQYMNALAASIIVLSGFVIVKKISKENNNAMWIYLILSLLCIPMYFYTMYIYGEIISTMFVMLAYWMLLTVDEKHSVVRIILFGFFCSMSVLFRTNCYIAVAGFIISLIIKFITNKSKAHLLMLASLVVFVLLGQYGINILYSKHKKEDVGAIPSIAYVTMGLNDDYGQAGWYNDYNIHVIENSGYNSEVAKETSYKDLIERLEFLKDNPAYARNFFNRKIQAQWNAPMYQALHMNNKFSGDLNIIAYSAYYGKLRNFSETLMKIYQVVMYASVLFFLIKNRKEKQIDAFVLLIVVFGGFLFSVIWEAKTRYIFPYLLMMVPYFACGLSELCNYTVINIRRLISKNSHF